MSTKEGEPLFLGVHPRRKKASRSCLGSIKDNLVQAVSSLTSARALDGRTAAVLAQLSDPERPITVDIGCGYGVGLLGLARGAQGRRCNLIGCDLNPQAVRYANGIAARWGLRGRAVFVESVASTRTRSTRTRSTRTRHRRESAGQRGPIIDCRASARRAFPIPLPLAGVTRGRHSRSCSARTAAAWSGFCSAARRPSRARRRPRVPATDSCRALQRARAS